ncbi:unnamed protein product [Brachionus calyciflorus]|uniref:Integrase catalytic domain-containing protein n=1 Tax=Brachionus calyciflorus TaxID=104777 RepID=A0A814MRX8_9BILA|nr:unnamed protein product [Brachionus calyciflorus]
MNDQNTQSQNDEIEIERKKCHQELFEDFLKKHTEKEESTSLIISQEKYDLIVKYIDKTIEKFDHNKAHYFKKQQFNIHKNLHSIQRGHIGINKLEQQLSLRYYGKPRILISSFIQFCPICSLKQIQTTQPRIKPIRSNDFLARLQIDLVDMRHRPCQYKNRNFKWIAHVVDHFSKFHILWAMEHKSAEEVVEGLEERVFSLFGLPTIFQSDYGTEFKNSLLRNLIESWEGECKIIHGRPRHPQSQGLVEQSNGTMERMIASMMSQFHSENWVKFLPKIMFNLNTQQKEIEEIEKNVGIVESVEQVEQVESVEQDGNVNIMFFLFVHEKFKKKNLNSLSNKCLKRKHELQLCLNTSCHYNMG